MKDILFLDTSFIINLLRGALDFKKSEKLLFGKSIMISSLVEYELRLGQSLKSNSKDSIFNNFINGLIVIPVNSEIVTKASEIQSRQIKLGKKVPIMDLLIGTTALLYEAAFITQDNDFEVFRNMGLELILL